MELPNLARPDRQTPERAAGIVPKDSIMRGYNALRFMTGILGTTWPLILVAADNWFYGPTPRVRGSISAYYHSGMHDWFVGVLFAIAPMLIAYKLFEVHLDNLLSTLAGIAAFVVALFPTGRASAVDSLTAFQRKYGETTLQHVHFAAAVVFAGCLIGLSILFAIREYQRDRWRVSGEAHFSPTAWAGFHTLMAAVMALAIGFLLVTWRMGALDGHRLFIAESLICIAFGLSWLTKGGERDVLRGMPAERVPQEIERVQAQYAARRLDPLAGAADAPLPAG